MASSQRPAILVAVGDTNVGKTSLFLRFAHDEYTERPAKVEPEQMAYNWTFDVDGKQRNFRVYDTCGMNEYTKLRAIYYSHANCFLLCYEISNRDSFDNISSKWIPEIYKFIKRKRIPLILVGMKSDRRENGFVTADEAIRLKKKIGASAFVECSAKNSENIIEIFKAANRAVDHKRRHKKCCVIQ